MHPNDTTPFCQCGCGNPVRGRFLRGHNLRLRRTPDPNPSRLCHCGCGANAPYKRRYLPGHHKLKSIQMYAVDPVTGCWNWLRGTDDNGYGLMRDGGKVCRAHTVFYERFRGKHPEGMVPHHTCENHGCVNPFHIEWKTRRDHASLHHAFLTPDEVAEIQGLKGRMSQRDIAKLFDVARGTVRYHHDRSSNI